MSITYTEHLVTLSDIVAVDDAESLLDWLQQHPLACIDLAGCTHLHPANLQVLMAAQAKVSVWPTRRELARWLAPVLDGPMLLNDDPDTGADA